MAKLQKTIRANGSIIFSVNIPLDMIQSLGWDKGDRLEMVKNFDRLVFWKEEEKKEDVSEIRDISGSGQELEILLKNSPGESPSNQHASENEAINHAISPGSEAAGAGDNKAEGTSGGKG